MSGRRGRLRLTRDRSAVVALFAVFPMLACGGRSIMDAIADPTDGSLDDDATRDGAAGARPDALRDRTVIIIPLDGPRDVLADASVTRDTGFSADTSAERIADMRDVNWRDIGGDDGAGAVAEAGDAWIDGSTGGSCGTVDAAPPDAACGQNGEACCGNATCAKCSLVCAGAKCSCVTRCSVARSAAQPPQAGTNILRSDGTVWYYATSATAPTVVSDANMDPVTGFTVVATSATFSCGIKRDRTTWCWWNTPPGGTYALHGELGDGTQRASQAPTQVVTSTTSREPLTDAVALSTYNTTTCAVRADASVYCWGYGFAGQLGNGTRSDSFVATPVLIAIGAPYRGADKVCVGESHACAHYQNDTVWCWGSNAYGQIARAGGNDSTTPSEVIELSGRAHDVECGRLHTCARSGDRVYCWGDNRYGMGNGTQGRGIDTVKEPNQNVDFVGVTELRVAHSTSCVLRGPSRSLWCWGSWPGDNLEHLYPGQPVLGGATMSDPFYLDVGVAICFAGQDGEPFLGEEKAMYPINCPP